MFYYSPHLVPVDGIVVGAAYGTGGRSYRSAFFSVEDCWSTTEIQWYRSGKRSNMNEKRNIYNYTEGDKMRRRQNENGGRRAVS